jgi:hypothetical protein
MNTKTEELQGSPSLSDGKKTMKQEIGELLCNLSENEKGKLPWFGTTSKYSDSEKLFYLVYVYGMKGMCTVKLGGNGVFGIQSVHIPKKFVSVAVKTPFPPLLKSSKDNRNLCKALRNRWNRLGFSNISGNKEVTLQFNQELYDKSKEIQKKDAMAKRARTMTEEKLELKRTKENDRRKKLRLSLTPEERKEYYAKISEQVKRSKAKRAAALSVQGEKSIVLSSEKPEDSDHCEADDFNEAAKIFKEAEDLLEGEAFLGIPEDDLFP